jgi:hypothetical protein
MPTRKQRRRRAKEQRHEYEVVYLDEHGNEVEVEEEEERPARRERAERSDKRDNGRRPKRATSDRAPDPPTWRKSSRRALIMAPFFFVFLYILQRDLASAVLVSAFYAAVFVPFSYAIDRFAYRTQMKRLERR